MEFKPPYNQVIHQDCIKFTSSLEKESVNLIVTDPPYGVNFKTDIYNDSQDYITQQAPLWLNSMYNVLKDNSHCYIFTGTKSLRLWLNAIEDSDFIFQNIINLPSYCNGQYLKNNFYYRTEHILFLSKGKSKKLNEVDFIKTSEAWLKDKRNTKPKPYTYSYPNFWDFVFANSKANTKKNLHPNQKNVELLKILIQLSSNVGDTVLDPFAGSGSTAIASIITNRKFLGCDSNQDCVDISNKRIHQELNLPDYKNN
jgi:site-specific DNA-methyltransferase (adenine-specific)